MAMPRAEAKDFILFQQGVPPAKLVSLKHHQLVSLFRLHFTPKPRLELTDPDLGAGAADRLKSMGLLALATSTSLGERRAKGEEDLAGRNTSAGSAETGNFDSSPVRRDRLKPPPCPNKTSGVVKVAKRPGEDLGAGDSDRPKKRARITFP